jgi:DNA-cytosine methyltransferase
MNVVSYFDGMACGRLALEKAGIEVDEYFAYEIDKYAIKVALKNYPDIKQMGSVVDADWNNFDELPNIGLFIGGSPCQGFSFAGKQLNFDDPRSALFFEWVRALEILRTKNPDIKFLLENVKMKKEYERVITDALGVEPIEINSALVSAQNRKRLYWTNIEGVEQPEDRGILLKNVVFGDAVACGRVVGRRLDEKGIRKDYSDIPTTQRYEMRTDHKSGALTTVQKDNLILTDKALEYLGREVRGGRTHWDFKHHSDIRDPKSSAVVANFFKGVPYNVLIDEGCIRKFHPVECERLQTVPDNYTEGVSNTQRYKTLGNGWTIDVIAHIFKNLI